MTPLSYGVAVHAAERRKGGVRLLTTAKGSHQTFKVVFEK